MRPFPIVLRLLIAAMVLALGTAPAGAQMIRLPAPPELTPEGRALILEFETGGRRQYERWPRPEWPGAASGVTVGIGYDCGYNSRLVIVSDWQPLPVPDLTRLAATAGITGISARPRAQQLRDILIDWQLAEQVFTNVTIARFDSLCRRTYPGYDQLRPNARAALLSLTFNRGNSLVGPRRIHMRTIAALSARRDYAGMAAQIRAMIPIWRGTDIEAGMTRRRNAEARLMEFP